MRYMRLHVPTSRGRERNMFVRETKMVYLGVRFKANPL